MQKYKSMDIYREERTEFLKLFGSETDEANTKTHRRHLVRYFTAQNQPIAVLQLQFDI